MNQQKRLSLLLALTPALFLLLSSCAGPESYQQKMARYEPKTSPKNLVPDIKVSEFQFVTNTKKNNPLDNPLGVRSPASVEAEVSLDDSNHGQSAGLEMKNEDGPSNKKLYFLTLYSEYEILKNYTQEFRGPEVSICPNFHTSLLSHKTSHANLGNSSQKIPSTPFFYDLGKLKDEKYVSMKPEFQLSLSRTENSPKVIDLIANNKTKMDLETLNELVTKALVIHLEKTYSELSELCEYGTSDNYYIYENLISHIKRNKFEASSKNMTVLLKTTLFSNMSIASSLGVFNQNKLASKKLERSIASAPNISNNPTKIPYSDEVISRLNVPWSKQYFEALGK